MGDTLRELEIKAASATDRETLRVLFARASELALQHPANFDMQVEIAALKQKIVTRALACEPSTSPAVAAEPKPIPEPVPLVEREPEGVETQAEFESEMEMELDPEPGSPRGFPIPLWPFAVLGFLAIAIVGVRYYQSRRPAQLAISTTPPGAVVMIDGEARCSGDCTVMLGAGSHQISAVLDGYLPAVPAAVQMKGQPSTIALALKPVDPAVRIITDIEQAKVSVDGLAPADVSDGQFLLEHLSPGNHTLRVFGKNGEALMSIESLEGKAPTLTAPVVTRDLFSLVVSSFTGAAKLSTGTSGVPIKLNGADADLDLREFKPGVNEISVGEKSIKENFSAAPMLTAFLKSDVNAGTLIVVAGEDDAKIFLNGVEYTRRTQKGQLRIQTLGQVRVVIAKEGYEQPPPQTVQIKKGQETRVEFVLKEIPKSQPRQVEVTRSDPTPPPPPPVVETPKPVPVERKQEPVKERVAPPPPPQSGSIAEFSDAWKPDEGGGYSHKGGGFLPYKLAPDGTFTFTVKLLKGGSIFRGGRVRWFLNYVDDKNYSLYETDGKTFWASVYIKGVKYERTKTPLNLGSNAKAYTIQIEVTPEHTLTRLKNGDKWLALDGWIEPGRDFTQGKFGFLIQGNDEIALSDFQFVPR